MKKKTGFTIVELLVVVGIVAIVIGGIFTFSAKHVVGNRQIIDFNRQRFNYAYILGDNGKWEKQPIRAWKDWDRSDSIQVVFENGTYMYTHLNNVKLSSD